MGSKTVAEESFKPSSFLPYRIRPFRMIIYIMDCTNISFFFIAG